MPTNKTIDDIANKKVSKPKLPELTCTKCAKVKSENSFYKSFDPDVLTGRLPYCKQCIKSSCRDEKGHVQIELVKKTLKAVNRPFIAHLYKASFEENSNAPVGTYFKNIAIRDFRTLTWDDSNFDGEFDLDASGKKSNKKEKKLSKSNMDHAYELFGYGFTDDEYRSMWEKYNFLKNNYPGTTNLHIEHLTKYVIFDMREQQAIIKGDPREAKDWGALRQKAAQDAKLNISQLSKSDLQGGLNSFSEYSRAAEEVVDIIKILPQFKYRPNDAVDFCIWCYVNYIREAEGKPTASYPEIYSFYDRKKEEYIKQYGDPYNIFTDDTTEDNRENIQKFITIPIDLESDE